MGGSVWPLKGCAAAAERASSGDPKSYRIATTPAPCSILSADSPLSEANGVAPAIRATTGKDAVGSDSGGRRVGRGVGRNVRRRRGFDLDRRRVVVGRSELLGGFFRAAGPIEAKSVGRRFDTQTPVARSRTADTEGHVASVDGFDRQLLDRRRFRPRLFTGAVSAGDLAAVEIDRVIEAVMGPNKVDGAETLRMLQRERRGGGGHDKLG